MKRHVKFVAVIAMAFCLASCGYNRLKKSEETVFRAWADVEASLHRRVDLIPMVVEIMRGHGALENDVFETLIKARANATQAQLTAKDLSDPVAMEKFARAQADVASVLSELMMVVERYPALKSNRNFIELRNQLEGTEARISLARQRYNTSAEAFNLAVGRLPERLTNRLLLHLKRKECFKEGPFDGKRPLSR